VTTDSRDSRPASTSDDTPDTSSAGPLESMLDTASATRPENTPATAPSSTPDASDESPATAPVVRRLGRIRRVGGSVRQAVRRRLIVDPSEATDGSDAEDREDRARADAAEAAASAVKGAAESVDVAAREAAAAAPMGAGDGYGTPGRPLNRQSPFYVGFVGALGVLVAYGLVNAVTMVTSVLTLIVASLFLALGLDPIVQWLQKQGLRRGAAVGMVLVTVVGLFAGVVALVVPPVVTEATELATNAPQLIENLLRNPTLARLDDQYGAVTTIQEELGKRVKDQSLWTTLFGGVFGAGKAVLSGFFSAFTVLVLTLYFLASLPRVKASAYRMVPRSRRQRVTFLSEEITRRVGGYFIGQLGVAAINGVLSFIVMTILGMPYASVLAVIVGLLGLIPMVGATLGAFLVVIVALFSSTTDAIVVGIYYVVYQQLENYLIVPKVMSHTVSVPGSVTVVAALVGGSLLGVLGALMAIPIAAGLLLLYQEVLLPRQRVV
jgi:predicted PurR-regulated permease PerM